MKRSIPTSLALAVVPLSAAAVSMIAAWRFHVTVGDTAWLTQRVADAARGEWPLVGMPSSIGRGALATHHPGPAQFYWLAPWWSVFGFRGIVLGTAAGGAIGLGVVGALVRLLPGSSLLSAIGAQAAVAAGILTIGPETLADPWNPYAALAPAMAALVGLIAIASGVRWGWPALLIAGSVTMQLHVGLVPWTIVAVVAAVVIARLVPTSRPNAEILPATALAVFVLWLPPLIDSISGIGNLGLLWQAAFRGGPTSVGWRPVAVAAAAALNPTHGTLDGPWVPPDASLGELAAAAASIACAALAWLFTPATHWARRWLEVTVGAFVLWSLLATRALPFDGLLPSPYTRTLWPLGAMLWFGVAAAAWNAVPAGRWRPPWVAILAMGAWLAFVPSGYVGIDPATRIRAAEFADAIEGLDFGPTGANVTARNFLAGWWIAPTVTAELDRRGVVNGIGTDEQWDVESMTDRARPLDGAACTLLITDRRTAPPELVLTAPDRQVLATPTSARRSRARLEILRQSLIRRYPIVVPSRLARFRAGRGEKQPWRKSTTDALLESGRFSDLVIEGLIDDATLRDDEVAEFVELDHLADPDWKQLAIWADGC